MNTENRLLTERIPRFTIVAQAAGLAAGMRLQAQPRGGATNPMLLEFLLTATRGGRPQVKVLHGSRRVPYDVLPQAVPGAPPVVTVRWPLLRRLKRAVLRCPTGAFAGSGTAVAFRVNAWDLPAATTVRVVVSEAGQGDIDVAHVELARPPFSELIDVHSPSHLMPLMVTAVGRSGSTLLMGLLGAHAQIGVIAKYPYETTIARAVIRATMDDVRGCSRVYACHDDLIRAHKLPTLAGDAACASLERRLQRIAIEAGAAAVEAMKARVDAYYRALCPRIAVPAYFAEKNLAPQSFLWDVYAGAREIFLVRDFRDMLASSLAFNAKRGWAAFGRAEVDSDEAYAYHRARMSRGWVLEPWRNRREVAHLIKYEDLVSNPDATITGILAYLGLDAAAEAVQRLRASSTSIVGNLNHHCTSEDVGASIGRWRTDLTPSVRVAAQEAFAELLSEFGYPAD